MIQLAKVASVDGAWVKAENDSDGGGSVRQTMFPGDAQPSLNELLSCCCSLLSAPARGLCAGGRLADSVLPLPRLDLNYPALANCRCLGLHRLVAALQQ